jgi:hypothetical protein
VRLLESDIKLDPVVQEAASYLGFGVAGKMLRFLLPQLRELPLRPAQVLKNVCVLKHFSLGMFLAAYVGMYHVSIVRNSVLTQNL